LANIVWSRNASGDYTGTLVGAFTEDKTFISYNAFSDVTLNHAVELVRVDEDTLQLWTVSTGTGSTIDSVLNKTCVEIRIYK